MLSLHLTPETHESRPRVLMSLVTLHYDEDAATIDDSDENLLSINSTSLRSS